MKWTLNRLMLKAEREGVTLSDLSKRAVKKRAQAKRRYISKPKPADPYWEK